MEDWYDDYSWVYEPEIYSSDYYTGGTDYTPVDWYSNIDTAGMDYSGLFGPTLTNYSLNPTGDNILYNGDWYSGIGVEPSQSILDIITGQSYNPYSLANWTATDIANAGYGDTDSSGSILDDIWGGVKTAGSWLGNVLFGQGGKGGLLSNQDLWKAIGSAGMIASALKGGSSKETQVQDKQAQLLPGAQAGVNEILGSALPFARGNVLSPRITPETQGIYDYLFGGGGGTLQNLLTTGQQARNVLTEGAQAIDTNAIAPLWTNIIAQETLGKFTPFQQTGSGNVQKAIVDEVVRQATVPLAQKQADYAISAAGMLPKIGLTDAGLLSFLMDLGQFPVSAQQSEFETYMNVIKALLGLPSGTAGTTTTEKSLDIWSKLLPMFMGMATTGTEVKKD